MAEYEKEIDIGTQVISLIEDRIKDVSGVKNKRHAVGRYVVKIINALVINLCDEYGIKCSTLDGDLGFDEVANELYN
jgi:hypothetical protein